MNNRPINQLLESDNNHSGNVSLFFLQAIGFTGCMQGYGGTAALVPPYGFYSVLNKAEQKNSTSFAFLVPLCPLRLQHLA